MVYLLRLKHWQLFLLQIGIPVILSVIFMSSMITAQKIPGIFFIFPIVMAVFSVIYFAWFYALGTNLHRRLPPTVNLNLTLFRISLLVPIAYILFICFFMYNTFRSLSESSEPVNIGNFAIIVPLHLFSMFCIFYCLYFNAKALKSVELKRAVTFSDFAGEFFLLWFFPVGVWIVQPRINKLFEENPGTDELFRP